jgi:hypothetical protein
MNINQLNSASLKKAVSLLEKKEFYLAKVAEIEEALTGLFGSKTSPASPTGRPARRSKPAKRGQLKATIVDLIRSAGPQGIELKEICQRTGLSSSRINTWLYVTGKAIHQIKRLERGRYAWAE